MLSVSRRIFGNGFRGRPASHSRSGGAIEIGDGYPLKIGSRATPELRGKVEPIKLFDKQRLSHMLTVGSTGTGKTRFLELLVEHDIKEGFSLGVFDPKPDRELLARIVKMAFETGREEELIIIRPDKPDKSGKVNPFAFYHQPEELVQHVMAGIPPSTDEFFRNIAYEVSTVVILGKWLLYKYLGKKAPFTVEDLRAHVSRNGLARIDDQLKQLSGLLKTEGNDKDIEYLETIKACLVDLVSSPQDYFAKVTSTLRTTLTAMVVGSTGEILGRAEENIFLKRLLEGKRIILVVQSPAMTMRGTAFILMRTILSMFQSFVGSIYLEKVPCYKGKLDHPLFIHIDEMNESLYWDFVNLLNKSRGAGVGIHGLTQSIFDLFQKLGQSQAKMLLDNFNYQLFFRVNNPETSHYVYERIGKTVGFMRIIGQGEYTTREAMEPIVSETVVLDLPDRHFILFGKKDGTPVVWRGRVKHVDDVDLEVAF